jgi:hypothetical protein
MSTAPHSPAGAVPPRPAASARREIKLISHSMLFYWWPIWLLGFVMAAITYMEDHRLAILPAGSKVTVLEGGPGRRIDRVPGGGHQPDHAVAGGGPEGDREGGRRAVVPHPGVAEGVDGPGVLRGALAHRGHHQRPAPRAVVVPGAALFLVIALLITLVPEGWDRLLGAVGHLHIYINMAGYLFIATVVFILWAVSVFIFDQRTYMIVTPGQIRVCEHVGASIRTFDTTGLSFEKQRDDLFRHWLLGFFSGDLIVRTSGAEKETIRLPNVLWIGWRLEEVQDLLREKSIVAN